jgi:hypothetical protein
MRLIITTVGADNWGLADPIAHGRARRGPGLTMPAP